MPDRAVQIDSRNVVDERPIPGRMFSMYGRGYLRIISPSTRDG